MKIALFLLVLANVAQEAEACQPEALFAGTVGSAEVVNGLCHVQLKHLTYFSPSFLCPLSEQKLLTYGVDLPLNEAGACELKEEISGVAVFESASNRVILD